MSRIEYTIKAPGYEQKYRKACWAGYGNYIEDLYDEVDEGTPWETWFHVKRRGHFYQNTTPKSRATLFRAWEMLHADWFHPGEVRWVRDSSRQRVALVYSSDVPYWAMVNSCSVLRLHDDMARFDAHWSMLEEVFRYCKYEPHPFTLYWLAVCISGSVNMRTKSMLIDPLVATGDHTGHMPYDSNWVCLDDIKWMQRWNKDNLKKPYFKIVVQPTEDLGVISKPGLLSMLEDWQGITNNGREAHFVGRTCKMDNWITAEATAHRLFREKPEPRFSTKSASKPSMSMYLSKSSTNYVNIFEFIEEVIIPHNL